MTKSDDISQAVKLLKQTLPEMHKRNIPTTPENYAVWYEYSLGKNSSLANAIEQYDHDGTFYSDDLNRDLFIRYVASEHEAAVNGLSDAVKAIVHEVLRTLTNEGKDLGDYASVLSRFSQRLDQASNPDEINELISDMLQHTRSREAATENLQESLDNMASELKKLKEEVARLNSEATTDALTRVKNRRAFDNEIQEKIVESVEDSSTLSLLMLDIDLFKNFNDRFGHVIGDKVLRFVASLIQKNIKGNDTVYRYGGEEFAILLPETDFKGAMAVAEVIRSKLAAQTLSDSMEKVQLGTITASIGVASYREKESAESFIHRSDTCMYQAKRNGRNRVSGDEDEDKKQTQTYI